MGTYTEFVGRDSRIFKLTLTKARTRKSTRIGLQAFLTDSNQMRMNQMSQPKRTELISMQWYCNSCVFLVWCLSKEICAGLPPALPSQTCGHIQPSSFFRHCLSVSAVSLTSHTLHPSRRPHGNECYLQYSTIDQTQNADSFNISEFWKIRVLSIQSNPLWNTQMQNKGPPRQNHDIRTTQTVSHDTNLGRSEKYSDRTKNAISLSELWSQTSKIISRDSSSLIVYETNLKNKQSSQELVLRNMFQPVWW